MSEENFWILVGLIFVNHICRSFQLKRIEKKIDKLLKSKEKKENE